jgi:hypothetical protein
MSKVYYFTVLPDKRGLEKDLEARHHGLIEVVSWHLPRETEENNGKLSRKANVPGEI